MTFWHNAYVAALQFWHAQATVRLPTLALWRTHTVVVASLNHFRSLISAAFLILHCLAVIFGFFGSGVVGNGEWT